jgi:GT2 family glycosyltransferase
VPLLAQISVVIPTSFQREKLRRSVQSVLHQSMPDLHVIVVNNGGIPAGVLSTLGDIVDSRLRIVHLEKNNFFCAPVNYGVSISSTPYVATLNDDAWLGPFWAENIISTFEANARIGSVASLVVQAANHDKIDSAGSHVDLTGRASNLLWGELTSSLSDVMTPVFSVSSCCAAYRRDAWDEAGGLDEDFIAYVEDIDLGFRMQLLGMQCLLNPACRAYHYISSTPISSLYKSFLIERNHLWNVLKNFPTPLLRRYALPIISSNIHPVMLRSGGSQRSMLKGKLAAVARFPEIIQKRRVIQGSRRTSVSEIETLLAPSSPAVSKL